MNKEQITYLCQRYLDNSASTAELEELESVLADPNLDPILKEIISDSYYSIVKQGLNDLASSTAKEKSFDYIISQPQDKRPVRLWPRIAAAASIILCLSISGYFIFHKQVPQQIAQNQKQDIAPGGNKATLTLAGGKQIILTGAKNGKLAMQGNIVINKTTDGEVVYDKSKSDIDDPKSEITYNTIKTPRAGKWDLTLADGTKVWLDAASSITYPIVFTGNERKVEITGQAYLEVAHNAAKPFRVITNGQTVEVLGTHFNINAYADEPAIKTTLLEGSVKVSRNGQMAMLKPGQQAQINRANSKISIIPNADIDDIVAWKNGRTQFNNADIKSIMRMLSRWYDIDVSYQGNIYDGGFGASVSRSKNISEVLKVLQLTGELHFKIEGRRVTVMP